MKEGYDQEVEDRLLASVPWERNLDCLYEISVWASAHDASNFLLQNESNAAALSVDTWRQLGGFREGFASSGDGLANLEFFSRAVMRPDAFNVLLYGKRHSIKCTAAQPLRMTTLPFSSNAGLMNISP